MPWKPLTVPRGGSKERNAKMGFEPGENTRYVLQCPNARGAAWDCPKAAEMHP